MFVSRLEQWKGTSNSMASSTRNLIITGNNSVKLYCVNARVDAPSESSPLAPSSSEHTPKRGRTENDDEDVIMRRWVPPFRTVPGKFSRKIIDSYAWGILLSTSLRTYKSAAPKEYLINIFEDANKYYRVEWNFANREKLISKIEKSLMQVRSTIKKYIRASVACPVELQYKKYPVYVMLVDRSKRQDIYDLTKQLVQVNKIQLSVDPTVDLCARVAYMRHVYLQDQSDQFWDTLDESLLEMYDAANNDPKKIQMAFRAQLDKDRKEHGVDAGYEITEKGSEFQEFIDELIQKEILNANTTT
ncbi:hypothetical protein L218DRAFT_958922 [Marasmius fiardii PR-910]|nr:hypothetical protein L218DRAFT_958922 [Marasmius fiardii PR-910]